MNRVIVLAVGLALCSIPVLAGEFLMNEEVAYGLRVTFSEPVVLGYFGDVLTVVSPRGEASVFTFSGAELPPWVGHGLAWTPATARIASYNWLATPPLVEIPEGGLTTEDLLNLGRAPTYKEIMSAIAEYPGEDEPIYEPAPDEAIWLTDLEGHADIYDNDSIKINYANWFDQSQITRIEVYRNGVRMEFMPDVVDVLTNEQMKTFDGNPLEHTPASDHTDHAIWGYEYEFRFFGQPGSAVVGHSTVIRSSFRYQPEFAFANFLLWWDDLSALHLGEFRYADVLETTAAVKALGIRGASINVEYFMESHGANGIYSMDRAKPSVLPENLWTASDADFIEAMRIFEEADLEVDVRMEVWVEGGYAGAGACRQCIQPQSVSSFFANYTATAVSLARLAAEEGAAYFSPLTEMDSLSQYNFHIRRMLDEIDAVFDGAIGIEESTHHYLRGDSLYDERLRDPLDILAVAEFWDWQGSDGNPLQILMSCWGVAYDDKADQSFSNCVEGFVSYWMPAISYYETNFPGNKLIFGEIGVHNLDGAASGTIPENAPSGVLDDQEVADLWAAYLAGCVALDIDGLSAWTWAFSPEQRLFFRYKPGNTCLIGTPAARIIRAVMGSD